MLVVLMLIHVFDSAYDTARVPLILAGGNGKYRACTPGRDWPQGSR